MQGLTLHSSREQAILIVRKSQFTGEVYSMKLPCSDEQFDLWRHGKSTVQDIFPDWTPDQREFLLTGIYNEEWDQFLKGEER